MSRMIRSNRWPFLACLAAVLAVVLVGAVWVMSATAASARTKTFGSSLDHGPANAGSTCAEDGVTGAHTCTHVGSYFPGFSGHASSPVTGTITMIKLRAEGPSTL